MQGFLLVHRYASGYRGMFPSTYASGSQVCNDQGVALGWHLEGSSNIVADLKLELFRYPAPRYQTIVPSGSNRYGCSIRNAGTGKLKWKFSLYRKSWQTTPGNKAPGIRPIERWDLTRMEFRFIYTPGKMKWQSRIVLSWFQDQALSLPDYAVVQNITFNPAIYLRSTVQFVVFRVMHWENRIYLYEPGLYYSFNFPVCDGLGEKITWVVALKTGKRITLSGKLNTVVYHDRTNTGSGLDQRQGNRKWEMELQFRLNL